MVDLNLELVLYALIATASPLGLAATLAVISSGRVQSLAFAVGFVAAQLVLCALVVAVDGSLLPDRTHDHVRLRAVLEIAFGAALIALAALARRSPRDADDAAAPRAPELVERLRQLRASTALAAGVVLGGAGPRRVLLTALAGTSIAASGSAGTDTWPLVVTYTAIATLLVWVPVLTVAVAGERVVARLRAAEEWLSARQWTLAFYSLLAVGSLAIIDGIAGML